MPTPTASLPLSLLDLFPVARGGSPAGAVREAGALARRAEELGYARYWVAEHHNMPSIATSAPEVVIAHIASVTSRIRVGSGGIMMPNHTPLRVVEIFRTLEALFPNRIDLGIGRAPGTDALTSRALRRSDPDEVNAQIAEMLAFAYDDFPPNHPFAAIRAMPSDAPLPPVWMLGSTLAGARIAASIGSRYAFAGHFAMANARGALELYKKEFKPSDMQSAPYGILAVTVMCGENDEDAKRLVAPQRVAIARMSTGKFAPLESFDEALRYPFTASETAAVDSFMAGAIVGGPERVREGLLSVAARTNADELMVVTMMPDQAERVRSYERVAKVMGLGA